ncbi:response regulator transcription factor [Effusibacillus lacus]|uniref:DNA-binding response regulator n=1 Tax=Effusibacillus lacus TaxID=1348429 RepID=A0A292YK71_9BACL|nr:response regulator transcription factor [Effusibacillus lacus]TCS69803.1 two-component system alkaline phosphatase synthesis response regulator PhoP [Effusibacillus lacus]GAX88885.1 DNA-binding response regulator [Effusibacillus lacus]
MATRVLVVDDEESIVKLVEYNLSQAGFEVLTADNGLSAIETVRSQRPELIILDLMLPGMGGMDVCQRLRREGVTTPIIMLTAKDDEVDRILGLEMGADDYVTKPFSPRELVARVKAVLRRASDEPGNVDGVFHCGDITIDVNKYEVTIRGERVDLTPREFELLYYLAKNMGRVLSRDHLLDKVWGYEFAGDTRIVDVHISHLRDKLEKEPKNPEYIKTVRGVGYKLVQGEA